MKWHKKLFATPQKQWLQLCVGGFALSTEGREAHRATTRLCEGGIGGGRNWRKKQESKEKEEKVRELDTHKVILCKSCYGQHAFIFVPPV